MKHKLTKKDKETLVLAHTGAYVHTTDFIRAKCKRPNMKLADIVKEIYGMRRNDKWEKTLKQVQKKMKRRGVKRADVQKELDRMRRKN